MNNLSEIFKNEVNYLLRKYPTIKKIITSYNVSKCLNFIEIQTNWFTLNKNEEPPMISFNVIRINNKLICETNIKLFNKITFCLDNQQINDDISFLDKNNNEIYKTNLDLLDNEYINQTRSERLKEILDEDPKK